MGRGKEEEERKEHIGLLLRERKKAIYNLVLLLAASFVVLIGVLTMAWFARNRENGAGGMGVKIAGKDFDLITLSDDKTNKYGIYHDPYHQAIRSDETDAYDIWLVDVDSDINNYNKEGTDDGSLGIEPGSSGVIRFYIKPYQSVTVDFTFQTIGYNSKTTTSGGQTQVTMNELSSSDGDPACFLSGHVLLFENCTHDNEKNTDTYSGFIPTGNDGKRVLSKSFELGGPYDADTDNDDINDAYKVDIFWIWPLTLDTLVYNSSSASAGMICDRNAVAPEGEDNDYKKVVNNICTYPQYYIKGYSPNATYTEETIAGRNAMYNDADQDIGMNVEYVLLRLIAETASSNSQ